MKRLYTIWSILLVLLVSIAVVVPGCTPTTGTINVDATLDGVAWTGAVDYTLTGPGTSPTGTDSVDKTFTVDPGSWTCAYVAGGPGTFVDITTSPTQSVVAGEATNFTLNFVTPVVPPLDASIQFETWTINGEPVPPGVYPIGANTIIDIEYKEHVSGEQGTNVTVDQTCWLQIHYTGGGEETMWLHVVNADEAVKMNPDATKLYQDCTVEGELVKYCDEIPLFICEPVTLDVEVGWELTICTDYTKTINWLGFPSPPDILFDAFALPGATFNLTAKACIDLDGDEDEGNDCTDWCEPLTIIYSP